MPAYTYTWKTSMKKKFQYIHSYSYAKLFSWIAVYAWPEFQFTNSCIEIRNQTYTNHFQNVLYQRRLTSTFSTKMKNKIDNTIILSCSRKGKRASGHYMFSIKIMEYDLYLFQSFFAWYSFFSQISYKNFIRICKCQ